MEKNTPKEKKTRAKAAAPAQPENASEEKARWNYRSKRFSINKKQ